MTDSQHAELVAMARRVRKHAIRMSAGGGCFLGASLSCADLLVYICSRFLNSEARTTRGPDRDYLLLSKGHDVPALYGTLAEIGLLDEERLRNHLSPDDDIYWHPNRAIEGIEFHSGSLGHNLAVGIGIAYEMRLRGTGNRVVVVLGDGELNEGSIWESLLVAHAYRLDNLVVVVDRNAFQANMPTEELIPLEPLADKFRAFGCSVTRIDGHDFRAMESASSAIPFAIGTPSVIIADTVRGKGLPSIEARADRWFCRFTDEEVTALLDELEGGKAAAVESETLVVR